MNCSYFTNDFLLDESYVVGRFKRGAYLAQRPEQQREASDGDLCAG